jgi:hypothetical protein
MSSMPYTFSSEIFKVAMNYAVSIPEHISRSINKKGHIPVKGKVNDLAFKGTMVPRKGGRHILYLNSEIRKKAGIDEFDTVHIEIEYDSESREIPIPEDVEMIFRENSDDWETFIHMVPSYRREILSYILEAKTPETRLRRIHKLRERMKEFRR